MTAPAPTAYDYSTGIPAQVAQRGRTAAATRKVPFLFNPALPETVTVDCGADEIWKLPRWLITDGLAGTGTASGTGWAATAHRWNGQILNVLLVRDGAEPLGLYVQVKPLTVWVETTRAMAAEYALGLAGAVDWDAEWGVERVVPVLCPKCAAGGLHPRCPNPGCRVENDRADAALDRLIASAED